MTKSRMNAVKAGLWPGSMLPEICEVIGQNWMLCIDNMYVSVYVSV